MKQRLHIHFGIHRTGTTSIHKHLERNLFALQRTGVCYPEMGVKHRHVKLVWQLISKKISPSQMLQQLKDEVPKETKLIILSSEDFSVMRNLDWLIPAANIYDISISIYLKRQDVWLESWYNQNIRWPWDKKLSNATPEVFLEHIDTFYWLNFDVLLSNIVAVMPRDQLYVNVIDSSGIRDTVTDFFRYCGINPTITQTKMENESISTAKLDILRRIDLFDLKLAARRRIVAAVKNLAIDEDDGSKTVFTDEQVKFILNKFKAPNQLVARKYFNREDLFLDQVKLGRAPCLVPDRKAYRIYIPKLLKEMAIHDKGVKHYEID